MRDTIALLQQAFSEHKPALCYSGGKDSTVLLHLVHTLGYRPPVVYVDPGLQNPLTWPHVQATCNAIGADLHRAEPDRTPLEQWQAQGWPILGPMPAANWMQRYRHLGVKLACNPCCERLKTRPGRKLTKALGCNAQLTGVRASDDRQRFTRLQRDGAVKYVQDAKLTVVHPLAHWTDLMVRRYLQQHDLPEDPATKGGGNGCQVCCGGWRFEHNALQACRRNNPALWWRYVVEWGAWLPLLVVKLHQPVNVVQATVARLGGIEQLASERPWVFDYLQVPPWPDYRK